MLMRAPGLERGIGSHLPTYEEDIALSNFGAKEPLTIQPMSPLQVADLPLKRDSHQAYLKQQKIDRLAQRTKRQRAIGSIARVSFALTLIVGTPVRAFQADQDLAPYVYGSDPVAIETISSTPCEEPYDEQKVTILFAGTGEKNPAVTYGPAIASAFEESCMDVVAVKEGAAIFMPKTEEVLDEYIKDNNDKIVDVYGRSVGGKEALMWLNNLRDSNETIYIRNVFLDSSPSDGKSTFQLSENDFSSLSPTALWAEAAYEANTSGGPFSRMAIELEQRKDQFYDDGRFNINKFYAVFKVVAKEKLNQNAVSNETYLGQVAMTMAATLSDDIEAIATTNDNSHPLPSLYYLSPDHDQIVNGPLAIAAYKNSAEKYKIPFTVIPIKDADHANPLVYKEKYIPAILAAKALTNSYSSQFYGQRDTYKYPQANSAYQASSGSK